MHASRLIGAMCTVHDGDDGDDGDDGYAER